ncbi:glycerate kinase [uncultured Corynebacterium sp.]|uniref:glycerate kinase n=1 Tax=uncultured Corynebacterium sp. TaxID=159447 RepID=UPI0025D7DCD1|nr:glycerate kinase [uncultured Corynebacterium sp.]
MIVIVAPDSFKGTATAAEAAAGIAAGVREELPDATVVTIPMADGGEGTAEALATAAATRGAEVATITLPVTDAVGRLAEASYYLNLTDKAAYIDVAAATGLPAVADALDPLHADSYGTGVLIADAEAKGAESIYLGLGGSATIDGGTGILAALGAAVHDARGYALPKGGAPLVQLDTIDTVQLNMKAALLDYTLLSDTRVTPAQSTIVYGPQKGAKGEHLALLTGAMLRLCDVTGIDPDTEYFGAAGCIPVGLTWVSRILWGNDEHARVCPGAEVVAAQLGLGERLRDAALLITGEGKFDSQSLTGKVVGTLADMTRAAGVPLGIVAGVFDDDAQLADAAPGAYAAELTQQGPLQEQLREAGRSIARAFAGDNA